MGICQEGATFSLPNSGRPWVNKAAHSGSSAPSSRSWTIARAHSSRLPATGESRPAGLSRSCSSWSRSAFLVFLSWLLRGVGLWGDLAFAIIVTTGVFWVARRLAEPLLGEGSIKALPRAFATTIFVLIGVPVAYVTRPVGVVLLLLPVAVWAAVRIAALALGPSQLAAGLLAGRGRGRCAARDRPPRGPVGRHGGQGAEGRAGGLHRARRARRGRRREVQAAALLRLGRAALSPGHPGRNRGGQDADLQESGSRRPLRAGEPRGGDRREPRLPRARGGARDAARRRRRKRLLLPRRPRAGSRLRRLLVVLLAQSVTRGGQGLLRARPAPAAVHLPGARRATGRA